MSKLANVRSALAQERESVRILRESGIVPPVRTLGPVAAAAVRTGLASGPNALAAIHRDRVAVVDEKGILTYRELAARTNAITKGLLEFRKADGQVVLGLMCRNSSYMLMGLFAGIGIGAKLVMLNTDMGRKQMAEVCRRERIDVVAFDEEFESAFEDVDDAVVRVIAWPEGPRRARSFDDYLARFDGTPPRRTSGKPDVVILTSGSSGTPKGASRQGGGGHGTPSSAALAGFFQKIPIRGTDRIFVGPPAFHGWGAIVIGCGLATGAAIILDRRFDAQRAVDLVVKYRCTAIILVPTMLRRMLALGSESLAAVDRDALRIIGSGGAKLDVAQVKAVQEEFGDVLHNLYGATEASFITIATPEDLAVEPACAGKPPIGVTVKIIRDGAELPVGETGDIYVGSMSTITQYTNGEEKETFRGLMKTGDTGRFDSAGRLFVEGRADGMIVSGGENVFPEEVELVLGNHPGIDDVKVVPVPDDEYGQRLRALIVADSGADLTEQSIKEYVKKELSRSRVPRDIIVVPELPRTATGKVAKTTVDRLVAEFGSTQA